MTENTNQGLVAFVLFCLITVLCTFNSDAQTVSFSSNIVTGCSPLIVHLNNQSTGNITDYSWVIVRNNNVAHPVRSDLKEPDLSLITAGKYSITLTITVNGVTYTSTKQDYIEVKANPSINIAYSKMQLCAGDSILITDNSYAGDSGLVITNRKWDFGDGTFGVDSSEAHVYNSSGSYIPQLVVTNNVGCQSIFPNTSQSGQAIEVQATPTPAFDYTAASCTTPIIINFSNKSSSNSSENVTTTYSWALGDNSSTSVEVNPTYSYNQVGKYKVVLTATNDNSLKCSQSTYKELDLSSSSADFSYTASCVNREMTFINTTKMNVVESNWDFGDGTKSSGGIANHVYSTPGSYTVVLTTLTERCTLTQTKIVSVGNPPNVSFSTLDGTSCKTPFPVQFVNNSAGEDLKYDWDFGDGTRSNEANPQHVYVGFGKYSVKLVAYISNINGCKDSLSINNFVNVEAPQILRFQNLPISGCAPLQLSLGADYKTNDPIVEYKWYLGNGDSSNSANPSVIYGKVGSYRVELMVTTQSGCQAYKFFPDAINVGDAPTANFVQIKGDICGNQSVSFQNTSNNATGYLWDFGDGTTSSEKDPSHLFQDTGSKTVTLIAINKYCQSEKIIAQDLIKVKGPVNNIEILNDCKKPFVRSFIDKSLSTSWTWNLGDGTSSNTQNIANHTYEAAGTYHVTLHGEDSISGCFVDIKREVHIVNDILSVSYEATSHCESLTGLFRVAGYNDISDYSAFIWNYGDGIVSDNLNSTEKTHVYTDTGSYVPKMTATDLNGCKVTLVTDSLIVKSFRPIVKIDAPSIVCLKDNQVKLEGLTESLIKGQNIVSWLWDFGDSTATSDLKISEHNYSTQGLYTISLTATDNYSCVTTINKKILLSQPIAKFQSTSSVICSSYALTLNNQSIGDSLIYKWDFGDDTYATETNPKHSYTKNNIYFPILVATDKYNCSDLYRDTIGVRVVTPVAGFINKDTFRTCPLLEINPINTSTDASSIVWDFGDGGNSATNIDTPYHSYALPGTYILKLTATGVGGCSSSVYQTLIVKGPSGKINYTLGGCAPKEVLFNATNTNELDYIIWDYRNGVIEKRDATSISYSYNSAGTFYPQMILVKKLNNDSICQVPIKGRIPIVIKSVEAYSQKKENVFSCDSYQLSFIDSSIVSFNDSIVKYKWTLEGKDVGSENNSNVTTIKTSGLYTYHLAVETEGGCLSEFSDSLYVKISRSPEIDFKQHDSLCLGSSLSLAANNLDKNIYIKQWSWNLGDGTTRSDSSLVYTYQHPGKYDVHLAAINYDGCSTIIEKETNIVALPVVNAGQDMTLCEGSIATINVVGNALKYIWHQDESLSCLSCQVTLSNTRHDAKYIVTGTGAFNCINRDTIAIAVIHPQQLSVKGRADICIGEQVNLMASGTDSYQWLYNPLVVGNQSSAVNVTPQQTSTFVIVGSDNYKCFFDTIKYVVTVHPLPFVEIVKKDLVLNFGASEQIVTTNSNDVVSWQWYPVNNLSCSNCSSPVLKGKSDNSYIVTVKNDAGCVASTDMKVKILCNGATLFLPNTFSPNGDGVNDIFYPRSNGDFNIRELRIFNRWGQCIFTRTNFHPNDKSQGWDGKYDSKLSDNNVFVYVMKVDCGQIGEPFLLKGDVTLLR